MQCWHAVCCSDRPCQSASISRPRTWYLQGCTLTADDFHHGLTVTQEDLPLGSPPAPTSIQRCLRPSGPFQKRLEHSDRAAASKPLLPSILCCFRQLYALPCPFRGNNRSQRDARHVLGLILFAARAWLGNGHNERKRKVQHGRL